MMIEIGLVIAVVMASGTWLKTRSWFPNDYIPLAIVVMAVAYNAINALLFGEIYWKLARWLLLRQRLLLEFIQELKIRFRRGMWSDAAYPRFCSSRAKEPLRT
ncbi:hypothetical protein ACLMAB_19485 [Brevibacillus laterosporus]